jgi:hypothetical protein
MVRRQAPVHSASEQVQASSHEKRLAQLDSRLETTDAHFVARQLLHPLSWPVGFLQIANCGLDVLSEPQAVPVRAANARSAIGISLCAPK